MKTAVGLLTTTILTAMVATGASAEWRLYVNRDNKAWSLERAYVSNDECDRAARTLYRSGQALGVGCAEYPAPGSAQASAPRTAEYSRSTSTIEQQVARADEMQRASTSRASRVTEYPVRPARRSAPVSESHPAAVIFPPSGGMEIRQDGPARPAAVAQPAPQTRRQAAPPVAHHNAVAPSSPDEDKSSPAVMLAQAATGASAAPARETEAEAAKREAAIVAEKAERRTTLAVFGGVALVILTGFAYSVYRAARTSPLRALAVGLIEAGALTAALAYPVVELWTRLKISSSIVLSWMPGLLAGIVVAGVGVIVLALDRTRKPARPNATGAERKSHAPVELIKPGEYVKSSEHAKTEEPSKPAAPVGLLPPIRPIEPGMALDAPRPEPPKWAAPRPTETPKPVDAPRPVEAPKPVEAAKPIEPPKWVAPKSVQAPKPVEAVRLLEPVKPVEAAQPAESVVPVEAVKPVEPDKPLELVTPLEVAKQVEPAKSVEEAKPSDAPAPVAGGS